MLKKLFDKPAVKEKSINLYGPNVAVVAIAKDEGAYIHEWIHHYLFMGFTKIFIGINRTTDETLNVLSNVNEKFENVFFEDMSWLDQACVQKKNPQIQSLSYAYFSNQIQVNHKEITHILYCDIDEFWFSSDFSKDITTYIGNLPKFDALSFNWLNQNGDKTPFEKPFKNLTYQPDRHMKTIHCVKSIDKIVEFRCHASRYYSKFNKIHLDSNGVTVKYGEHDQAFHSQPPITIGAFVLHRWARSQLEYTAMLLRERPGVEIPIKNNRSGFVLGSGSSLEIDHSHLQNYWESLDMFIVHCDLQEILELSINRIKEKSTKILDVTPDILIKHLKSYFNVLKGTEYHTKIIDVLEADGLSYLKDDHAKNLFDTAIHFENLQESRIALRYLELAHKAQSEEPEIYENLKRLRAQFS